MTFTPLDRPAPDDLRIRNVRTRTVRAFDHDANHPLTGTAVPLAGQDIAMPDIYMGTCLFFSALQNPAISSYSSVEEVGELLEPGLQRLVAQFPAASASFAKVDGVWNIRYTDTGIPVTLATSDRDLGRSYIGRGGRIDSDVLPRGFTVFDHSDPAFAIKVTRFACGSIAIGTSVHHWVCDYAGYHDIMELLAHAMSDPTSPLPPRNNSRDMEELLSDVSSENVPAQDWFVQQSGGKVWESGSFALSPDSVTNVMLYFSRRDLERLKFETIRAAPGDDWVSTNDTLAALLWSSLTAARGLNGPGMSKAVLTVDGRRFIPASDTYVGNVHPMHSSKASLDTLSRSTSGAVLQVARTLRRDLRLLSRGKMAAIVRLQNADLTTSFMPNYKPFFGHDILISNLTKYDWGALVFGELGSPTYVSIVTSAPVQAGPFTIEGSDGSVFIQNAPLGLALADGDETPSSDSVTQDSEEGGGIRTEVHSSFSKPGVIAIVGIREGDVETFTHLPLLRRYATVLE